MSEGEHLGGGCRCGAVRYRVSGTPVMVEYCHCVSCRKASGSVVMAFAGFPREGLEILIGEAASFEGAPGVTRHFCGTCGSPLFYENADYPDEVYVTLGSFDDPEALPPDRHVWTSDRISWHTVGDTLPQYAGFSGDGSPGSAGPYEKP